MTTAQKPADIAIEKLPTDSFLSFLAPGASSSGDALVGATSVYYTKPLIDGDKLRDIQENALVAEQLDRLRALYFSEKYIVNIYNKAGEEDKDLEWEVTKMLESPGVRLSSKFVTAWRDELGYGACIINPVYEELDGRTVLTQLRRLPPESFFSPPPEEMQIYSDILRGITRDEKGNLAVYQTDASGQRTRLSNITLLTDPAEPSLTGRSRLAPLAPVISLYNFALQAQAQKVNRIGAPLIFIKITNPIVKASEGRDDIKYAQTILRNWGRNTAFVLRDNMEIITLDITESGSALETLEYLRQRIADYFNPAAALKREGSTIGGNAAAEFDLLTQSAKSVHRMLEEQFGQFIERYLEANAYEGYTVELHIPEPSPDRTVIDKDLALAGFTMKVITTNEARVKLRLPELDDAELAALKAEYPVAPAFPPGFYALPGQAPPLPEEKAAGFAEHVVTETEETLEAELEKIAERTKDRIIGALRNEKEPIPKGEE